MKSYPAHIWKEDNETYSIEFPDIPGCFSSADSLEEALSNASDALTAYLESLDSRSIAIPAPSQLAGQDIHPISPTLNVSFAKTLKHEYVLLYNRGTAIASSTALYHSRRNIVRHIHGPKGAALRIQDKSWVFPLHIKQAVVLWILRA